MSRFNISRRTVLRGILAGGAAVTVGLPMLETMLNNNGTALADGNPIPQRFVTWFFGNGFLLDRFVPKATGPNYPLSEQLMPLAPVQDYCNVLTGWNNRCEKLITHHEGMTIFNGYTFDQQGQGGLYSVAGGPTIDQVIADAIEKSGAKTTVKSIQIGVSRHLSYMDSGTTMHVLSHRSGAEPLPPEFNPQQVWTNLFGNFVPKNDPSGPLRTSVLDAVRDQTAALKKRLGAKDNQRLDAHLEGLDALQKKIEALPPACMAPMKTDETNPDVDGKIVQVNQVMSDLIAYAFACDVTRVASVLLVGGAAGTVLWDIFPDPAKAFEHHLNTHNPDPKVQNGAVHDGIVYQMARLSDFLQTLKKTTDPTGGNLLDNTLVYFSSDCSLGLSHSVQNMPIIVAGRGGGYLKPQTIHYAASGGNPSDVLLTMLRHFDPAAPSVGAGDPMSSTPFMDIVA
jgi:hypothetical protein